MGGARTWKAFDRDAMDRLHENWIVSDPASKTKPALLTDSPTRAHARSSNASGPPKAPPKG